MKPPPDVIIDSLLSSQLLTFSLIGERGGLTTKRTHVGEGAEVVVEAVVITTGGAIVPQLTGAAAVSLIP